MEFGHPNGLFMVFLDPTNNIFVLRTIIYRDLSRKLGKVY
jgi:hypothetical protein